MVVGIILLFVGTGIIPAIAQEREKLPVPTSSGNWVDIGWGEYINHSDIHTKKNLAYGGFKEVTYTEQPPPPRSEWDGIYEKYLLVSQEADIHYNLENQNGWANSSTYRMKYMLKDR